jgi:dipeptidyl aminopeptidase/acylaminoacyl peptidase
VPRDLGGVADLDASAEKVRIPVGEADHLDGWLLRGWRPGVIVVFHGYARDHHRVWRYAQFLRRDGWTVLAPDFRSSRRAGRKPTTLGYWELEDAKATLDWLRARPEFRARRVGVFGESLGGSVALALAAGRPDIAAVAVDSPFADGADAVADAFRYEAHVPPWPAAPIARALAGVVTGHDPGALDVIAAERAYGPRPLLLIQSGIEDRFGLPQVERLEQSAGSGATLWRVADAGHNRAWVAHRAEYERRVRAFFLAHLVPPGAAPPARTARPAARRTHEEVPA